MKNNIKRALTVVSLIIIPLLLVSTTQRRVDHNTLRIQGFYQEEKDSIDVILFGASEVFPGYSPAYAYKQYGFTSYSYAIDANYTKLIKYQIEEVLSYQSPKCIIIETSCYYNPRQTEEKNTALATLRKWTDGIPFSKHKTDIISQLTDSDQISYYFPFIMYHGNLENFSDTKAEISQKLRGYTYLKGITSTNKKTECNSLRDVSDDNTEAELPKKDYEYFMELIEYCKNLDCKVVFVRFPQRIENDDDYKMFCTQNYIDRLVTDNGLDFINLDKEFTDIGLVPNEDFYDKHHMNVNGQIKMTDYLGQLLRNEYNITATDLSENNRQKWDNSVKYIEAFYKYYRIHEKDEKIYWWFENPDLLSELEKMNKSIL